MPIASPAELAVLADDSKATRQQRIAAVWAHGHDLALERHGEDRVNSFFTTTTGNRLMAELQALPEGTSVADMLKAVEKHVGGGKEKPETPEQIVPQVEKRGDLTA